MPKNNRTTGRPQAQASPVSTAMSAQPTEDEITTRPTVPTDLTDLLDYLEGHYGDDEGRFDATYLWPWRNLTSRRRSLNERILRIILKRLLAPKAPLDQHWGRLHADIQEHRRRHKARGKLATANAAGIVLSAIVDALLPVREVPSRELESVMRDTSRAAAKLAACLTSLRDNGLNIEELLPSEETIRQDDEEGGGLEYGGGYEDARFFIHMKLRHWLAQEQRDEITEYVLRVILGDPAATLGILTRITQAAGTYKVRRHHLSGRQRFAYLMARHMVRDSERLFGGPRYERAEAFAKAASGVQVKGLRQMMEREKKMAAIKARKARGASLRGN